MSQYIALTSNNHTMISLNDNGTTNVHEHDCGMFYVDNIF